VEKESMERRTGLVNTAGSCSIAEVTTPEEIQVRRAVSC
jgi:hypothetical protein